MFLLHWLQIMSKLYFCMVLNVKKCLEHLWCVQAKYIYINTYRYTCISCSCRQSFVMLMLKHQLLSLQQSFLFWPEMLVLWVCYCSADRDNTPRTTVEKYFWGPYGERQVNRAKTLKSFQRMCKFKESLQPPSYNILHIIINNSHSGV